MGLHPGPGQGLRPAPGDQAGGRGLTHDDLVRLARTTLDKRFRCPLIITDMVTASSETPDAIGFKSFESILIEVKVSRGDFLRDAKKRHRQDGEGMGDLRYYMAPVGLLKPADIPPGWGLLEVIDGRVRERLGAERRKGRKDHEVTLLVSAIRRIGQAPPDGISVKCYTLDTERRATIGIAPEIHPETGSKP